MFKLAGVLTNSAMSGEVSELFKNVGLFEELSKFNYWVSFIFL
jgi:hypothetical protein